MKKTLIIYGTRKGATEDTAKLIAEILKNQYSHEVEFVDIRHAKSIKHKFDSYDNIFVGSSIVSGRWISRVKRFLKRNNFEGKNLLIFISAGGTHRRAIIDNLPKSEAVARAVERYIDPVVSKFNLHPIAKMAFGGRTKKDDNWNREDIINWIAGLEQLL